MEWDRIVERWRNRARAAREAARAGRSSFGTVMATGLGGLAIGAGLVYWLDPRSGARRRAEVQQKGWHVAKKASEAIGVTSRDLANRGRGLLAGTTSFLRGRRPSDEVVAQRVRSRLGRLSSHPGSIEVSCHDGRVDLRGVILQSELDEVLEGVRRVRGVTDVESRLEVHATPGDVPGLQGGAGRARTRGELMQANWSPAARVVAGGTGLVFLGYGVARRGLAGLGAGAAGAALLARSITNLELKRLVGIGAGRRAIDLRKTIHVGAPVEEVFSFFQAFENFPRFMSHVREVRHVAEGRWHWSVAGPAGVPVEWDAEVTALEPNRVIAWKSVQGAPIESAGIVRFEPERGGTRLDVRMSYNPPAGAVGHAIATLFGADPKKQMDDDLLRFKSLLERGKATGREETVTREELPQPPPSSEPPH